MVGLFGWIVWLDCLVGLFGWIVWLDCLVGLFGNAVLESNFMHSGRLELVTIIVKCATASVACATRLFQALCKSSGTSFKHMLGNPQHILQ